MSNRKVIKFKNKKFEYVNAIEIKELDSKYLIGQYEGSDKSIILRLIIDGDKYIVDASKRSVQEKEVLNKYFMAHDGGVAFKNALANGEIVSFYYDMPDEVVSYEEGVNTEVKKAEIKPIVISTTTIKIPSVDIKLNHERQSRMDRVNNLISSINHEIERYYDLVNSLVNNG